MVAQALVEADLKIGLEAATTLWKDPVLRPTAIVWVYDEDSREWRYLVGTADVGQRGPQAAYRRIHNLLRQSNVLVAIRKVTLP